MDLNTILIYLFVGMMGFILATIAFSLFSKKDRSTRKKERVAIFALAIWTKNSEAPFMVAFPSEIDRDKAFDALRMGIDTGQITYTFSNNIDGTYCFSVLRHITAVHKTNG